MYVYTPSKQRCICIYPLNMYIHPLDICISAKLINLDAIGWLRLVGSLKLYVSFAKEPLKRDDILQKRLIILRSLLIVATPYDNI